MSFLDTAGKVSRDSLVTGEQGFASFQILCCPLYHQSAAIWAEETVKPGVHCGPRATSKSVFEGTRITTVPVAWPGLHLFL